MKRYLLLFVAVLIGMVTYAQKWVREYHPADEMLNVPAYVDYTFEDSHVKLSFVGDIVVIDMKEDYNCFHEGFPELQIGYYDVNGKYLHKKTVNVTETIGEKNTYKHRKICYVLLKDEELMNYLLHKKGKVRFVAKGYYSTPTIDFKIPCFNNH